MRRWIPSLFLKNVFAQFQSGWWNDCNKQFDMDILKVTKSNCYHWNFNLHWISYQIIIPLYKGWFLCSKHKLKQTRFFSIMQNSPIKDLKIKLCFCFYWVRVRRKNIRVVLILIDEIKTIYCLCKLCVNNLH